MSNCFLLEPDIIAAAENVMPDLNNDLVLAKNFLKQQSAATGDSLLVEFFILGIVFKSLRILSV
jgi:hypothetical protein